MSNNIPAGIRAFCAALLFGLGTACFVKSVDSLSILHFLLGCVDYALAIPIALELRNETTLDEYGIDRAGE